MRYSVMGSSVAQVRAAGGKDIKETVRMGIIFATLTPAQVVKLKVLGCVTEPMGEVKAVVLPPSPVPAPEEAAPVYSPLQLSFTVGLEDFRALFDPPLYGEGVNIAIIDSGIRETHDQVKGLVVYRENFTSDPMRDGFDHGTSIAAILATIAPKCGILNMKVLSEQGTGTEEEVVLAIDKCIDLHQEGSEFSPSIINLSLGVPDDGNVFTPMRIACRAAIEEGIWVLSAAGNNGPAPGTMMSPAAERYVGAVGSTGLDPFEISYFSARGPTEEGLIKPDAVMFGENIILASSDSDVATVIKSGTSFSVAFVSGMVLIYIEGAYKQASTKVNFIEGLTPELFAVTEEELLDIYLPQLALKPQGVAAGKDNDYGHGLPYGPYAAKAIGVGPATTDLSAVLTSMMMVGMMGVMMKTMN